MHGPNCEVICMGRHHWLSLNNGRSTFINAYGGRDAGRIAYCLVERVLQAEDGEGNCDLQGLFFSLQLLHQGLCPEHLHTITRSNDQVLPSAEELGKKVS